METNANQVYDGFLTLERGVDSGKTPSSLQRNQTSFAVNATFRGGEPSCRPGWIKRELVFNDANGANDTSLVSAFEDGLFQGAAFYDAQEGESSLVCATGGRLYRISVTNGYRVIDITPSEAGSTRITKWWFCQAEEFLICQDGQMKPIIFDGGFTRRVTKDTEIPVGKAMAYAGGRLWVTLPDETSFIAGDLVYSSSGSPEYEYRDAVLNITENDYLNEGGAFGMPGNSGGIKALVPTNNLDTSLGQGPLLAVTPNLIASVQAPIDRTAWKNLEYPIQTIALNGFGGLSDRSAVTVNGDVFYRSEDGIRSFRMARRDFGQWGNTPISSEMNRVLPHDSRHMLEYSSAVIFDNRFLSTVSPYWVQGHGVAHRGLAVLDFDILSRMYGAQQPAWEGVWTGVNVLQLITGRFGGQERCFAFVLNGSNQIELWELSRDYPFDYGEGGDTRIEWSVEMKAFDFDSPFNQKQLEYGEIWVDDVVGKVNFSAEWRPDGYPKWLQWHSGWNEEATRTQTMASLLGSQATPRNQYRSKMRLPYPDYQSDAVSDTDLRNFFTLQPRLQVIGHCKLKHFRVAARHVTEFGRGAYRT
jgi:hypothetical protein